MRGTRGGEQLSRGGLRTYNWYGQLRERQGKEEEGWRGCDVNVEDGEEEEEESEDVGETRWANTTDWTAIEQLSAGLDWTNSTCVFGGAIPVPQ